MIFVWIFIGDIGNYEVLAQTTLADLSGEDIVNAMMVFADKCEFMFSVSRAFENSCPFNQETVG